MTPPPLWFREYGTRTAHKMTRIGRSWCHLRIWRPAHATPLGRGDLAYWHLTACRSCEIRRRPR